MQGKNSRGFRQRFHKIIEAVANFSNGFFSTPWGAPLSLPGFPPTGYALSASPTFIAPTMPLLVTLQFGMMDPSSAVGFAVSGAVEVDIL